MTAALALAAASLLSLTNDLAVLDIGADGTVVSLRERRTGRELSRPSVALACLCGKGRRPVGATAARCAGPASIALSFPRRPGELKLSFRPFGGGWTVVARPDGLSLGADEYLKPICLGPAVSRFVGTQLNMCSDKESGVVLRAYDEAFSMHADAGELSVAGDCGRSADEGRFGLVAGAREDLLPALKAMTREAGVRMSKTGGAWSLTADVNRLSTHFAVVTEESIDRWIDFDRTYGLGILHFSSWAERLGSYPVKAKYFPQGLDGMAACAKKAQAAGLLTGMHTLTGCLSVEDPMVARHVRDLEPAGTYTLAADLSGEEADALEVAEKPVARHDGFLGYSSNGNVLRLGEELIQYTSVSRTPPYRFAGLTRGAFGTTAVPHAKDEKVDFIRQAYLAFYPHRGTALATAIAGRIAEVFRACGHSDIYFDGAEGLGERRNLDAVRREIFEALQASPVVESSCGGAHGWWYRSRVGSWDYPHWGIKRFHDLHVKQLLEMRRAELLAAQSGWWRLQGESLKYPRMHLDEMEYFAAKNAAFDLPCTLNGISLLYRPLTDLETRMMEVFANYEKFRRDRAFSLEARRRMGVPGAEVRLRREASGKWMLQDVDVRKHRVTATETCRWTEEGVDSKASPDFRIEALYAPDRSATGVPLTRPEDEAVVTAQTNVVLSAWRETDAERGAVLSLKAENRGETSRGAWAEARLPFKPYRDLGTSAAFGLWVKGDGKGELLNVQLSSPREYTAARSEHYLRIDFVGWRYVTFLLRERDADESAALKWPYDLRYVVYKNALDTRHVSSVSYWLNDLPANGTCEVSVGTVEAFPVKSQTLNRLAFDVNGRTLKIPFGLKSGEFVECTARRLSRYSAKGELLEQADAGTSAALRSGRNEFALTGESDGEDGIRAEVTVFALGEKIPALADKGRSVR